MNKRFYIALIVLAVLLLALGRLVVRPPAALVRAKARGAVKAPARPGGRRLADGLRTKNDSE
jgi:hypothetical protein